MSDIDVDYAQEIENSNLSDELKEALSVLFYRVRRQAESIDELYTWCNNNGIEISDLSSRVDSIEYND